MFNKWFDIFLIGLLFIVLIAVRYFESYFYDPLIEYFKYEYLHHALPKIEEGKFFINLLLRYMINTIVSILILWITFRKKGIVIFSIYFYLIAFIILSIAFWFILKTRFENYYLIGFYVRRFLIQPLFIMILLPAFYYQKSVKIH
jgi:exosortase F-associated protein